MILGAGLVAAAGDRMGQLAARRKIRFGKLRPRDASRIVAVATGMAISVVTFGVVFAVWSDFREALTRYTDTKKDLANVSAQRDSMLSERDSMVQEMQDAEKTTQAAVEAMQEAETNRENAENKLQNLQDQLGIADQMILDKETELTDKQVEVDAANDNVAAARKELNDIESQKEGHQIQLRSLRELKARAQQDIKDLNEQIESILGTPVSVELGKLLAYQQISAGEGNSMARLNTAMTRLQVKFSKDGFGLDSRSNENAREIAARLDAASSKSHVVLIRSAANVFEGDDVLLGFESIELNPLVRRRQRPDADRGWSPVRPSLPV